MASALQIKTDSISIHRFGSSTEAYLVNDIDDFKEDIAKFHIIEKGDWKSQSVTSKFYLWQLTYKTIHEQSDSDNRRNSNQ